jgi:type IV pilus assembly protein PilA
MTNAKGFTLIELMIVFAILGILLAIAIPAYNDYTIRSKVSEGLIVATGAKSAVSETRQSTSLWPTNNQVAGIVTNISSTYVASVTIGAGGKVAVEFRNIDALVDTKTLVMTPTFNGNSVQWNCNDGTIDDRYVPARCR